MVFVAVVGPLLQTYPVPPEAVSVVASPAQIVVLPVMLTTGNGFTVMRFVIEVEPHNAVVIVYFTVSVPGVIPIMKLSATLE